MTRAVAAATEGHASCSGRRRRLPLPSRDGKSPIPMASRSRQTTTSPRPSAAPSSAGSFLPSSTPTGEFDPARLKFDQSQHRYGQLVYLPNEGAGGFSRRWRFQVTGRWI